MAIIFQEKEQRNLILVSIILVLILAVTIWWGFFREEPAVPGEEVLDEEVPHEEVPNEEVKEEIRINFEVLKLPILEKLEPFPEIEPFGQETGRENPFIPL